MGYKWVLFGELGLLLLLVIEGTFVLLGVAMFPAEDKIALAVEAKEANLLFALPAE